MSAAHDDSDERCRIVCHGCGRQVLASAAWIEQQVRCPHCATALPVPGRGADPPAPATPPQLRVRHRFSFACPRCQSLLESQAGMGGQTGRCPTCNARLVMPRLDPVTGRPADAKLIDRNDQDPTPMHAYAASGHQAPRIRRRRDGTLQIECPRCGTRGEITADNCPGCGIPFTMEGMPTADAGAGRALAVTALVLGIISLPTCWLLVPGALAVGFGLASWLRRATARPSGPALAGIILGIVSLALGVLALR